MICRELTREFRRACYDHVEASSIPEQEAISGKTLAVAGPVHRSGGGGESRPCSPAAPGNGATIGGFEAVGRERVVRGASVRDGDSYRIYAESLPGADHLRRIVEEAQIIVRHTPAELDAREKS